METYRGIRKFVEDHLKRDQNTLYIRRNEGTFALDLTLADSEDPDPPLAMTIRPWPDES